MTINNARRCLESLTDPAVVRDRLTSASDAAMRLIRYRDSVNRVARCPGAATAMGERAASAEVDARILIKSGLDAMNDMQDSGMLLGAHTALKGLAVKDGFLDVASSVASAQQFVMQQCPQFDATIFDSIRKTLTAHDLRVSVLGDQLNVDVLLDGKRHVHQVAIPPRVGGLGRISTNDLFSAGGTTIATAIPAMTDRTSHDQTPRVAGTKPNDVADAYGSYVAALAHLRDSMAVHAHVARYFGRPHVTNNAPLLVALVIVIAVAVIAAIAGIAAVAQGHEWGWILIAAAAALVVGYTCVAAIGPCVIVVGATTVTAVGV